MNQNKYTVGGHGFSSQAKLKKFTQGILKNLQGKHVTKGHRDWVFLEELLNRHPDPSKKAGVILKFEVRQSLGGLGSDLFVYKSSGLDRICWNSCITGKPKGSIFDAMRTAIIPQVLKYHKDRECVECKSTENLQTDHIVAFSKIAKEFMFVFDEAPEIFTQDHYDRVAFRREDTKYQKKWEEYHESRATYQTLCRTCNVKKSAI